MKTVLDNRQLAHVWAQQRQGEGRNASGSFRFSGDTLWSYQTPIALVTYGADDDYVALFSAEGYSNTTAKQLSYARRAWGGVSFDVPDIGVSGGRARTAKDTATMHANNLAWLVAQYEKEVARCLKVNTWTWTDRTDVRDDIFREWREVVGYARVFALPCPACPVEPDAERIWARCARLDSDPKRIARANAARERREELERAAREERTEDFRRGDRVLCDFTDEHGGALLRISASGGEVETSLGARVPVDSAARVVRVLDRYRRGVRQWERKPDHGNMFNVGHFTVDSFDEKGIRAGCHFIAWAEIERIRPALEGLQS